ncbi:MFS transporter [Microbispora hainanensis]|uniref:MFS transporter n=1 Tax=Microbispora hainanensis TaxID=568844 RepID=UPI001ABFC8B2|nr:MFS transporter [Microbispora hainanensis]
MPETQRMPEPRQAAPKPAVTPSPVTLNPVTLNPVALSPVVLSPGAWRAVAAAMFACGWGGNQFTPLLLMYRRLGGYSALSVDAFLGAYVVGLVPGLLLAGPVSDRRGRRPVLVAGTVASALASLVLCFGGQGAWPIYAGRLITGFAVGIAMSVGSSWVKELSRGTDGGLAARRAALCQTAGFGLGAGVAGVLAQWGPWPMVSPYAVHLLLTAAIPVLLLRVPETRPARAGGSVRELLGALADDLRVPAPARRRFRLVVLPMAPWVFGAAGLAYAVTPQLVGFRVGDWGLAYATGLTVLTLGTGAAVQPVARWLHSGERNGAAKSGENAPALRHTDVGVAMSGEAGAEIGAVGIGAAGDRAAGARTGRAPVVAMAVMLLGAALCAANAVLLSPWLAAVTAAALGAGYGIAVVSGLLEIQRMAGPDDLAGLTGVYYMLAYAGFLLPTVLAGLSSWLSYPVMLAAVAAAALVCLGLVVTGARVTEPAAAAR